VRVSWKYLASLTVAIPLALAAPQQAEAQCFACDGLACEPDAEVGTSGGCDYTTLCSPLDPDDCWTDCLPGTGHLCFEQQAVALSGQVVVPTPPTGGALANLEFDEAIQEYRHKCNGAIAVITGGSHPAKAAEPIRHLELR